METPYIMSLATSIKDFSDILNQIYTANELNATFSYLTFLQELFLFSIKNLGGAILYILSFNWLRDFSYLPLLAPQLNPSSYFEDSYFEDPLSHILSFSRLPSAATSGYATDQLLSGFINSFFFSLPFSLPHLISMRRLLSQGVLAGASSVLGTIAAHSLFLIGVVYGLRFLIIPWFSAEPLNYIVGIFIVVVIVNELAQEKRVYMMPRSKQRPVNALKIGALNFMLTWCEESTVFHSFNHLTLNAHNTYLGLYPSSSAIHSFVIHTTYLLAFIIGNCVFSFLFYFLILQSTQYLSSWTGLALAKIVRTVNKVVLFFIVAFALSSFPYYGLDYLLGKVGGFLPEDPAYMETVLSPTAIRKLDRDSDPYKEKSKDNKKVIPLDVNYFDHGVYLHTVLEPSDDDPQKKDFLSDDTPLPSDMQPKSSFEELNYRGEYAWTLRDRHGPKRSEAKTKFLSGLFKDSKTHYRGLKRESDKKQAEAASQADAQIPLGRVSECKEGVLPGETCSLMIKMEDFLGRDLTSPRESAFKMSENLANTKQSGFSKSMPEHLQRWDTIENDENTFDTEQIKEYDTELTESFYEEVEEEREQLLPVENLIKARYVFNPVYRTLLKTDIDAFLARQPSNHNLAANQEYNLTKKRQLLEKYYNWLRYYSPFEKELEQLYEIPQTKSFVDSVYHQQFKGTLKIVRRLFSVTLDRNRAPSYTADSESKHNTTPRRVLSYDQTLYTQLADNENPFLHEQLLSEERLSSPGILNSGHLDTSKQNQKESLKNKTKSITSFEDLESSFEKDKQNIDNDFDVQLRNKEFELNRSPFIEESNSSPIYAGWDDTLRQFVVTNKFDLQEYKNRNT